MYLEMQVYVVQQHTKRTDRLIDVWFGRDIRWKYIVGWRRAVVFSFPQKLLEMKLSKKHRVELPNFLVKYYLLPLIHFEANSAGALAFILSMEGTYSAVMRKAHSVANEKQSSVEVATSLTFP